MDHTPKPIQRLAEQLAKLPSIGPKSAARLAYHIVEMDAADVSELAQALLDAKEQMVHCAVCGNLADSDPCPICQSESRQRDTICVVSYPRDILAIEKTNGYKGQYHVLGGSISPMKGIGPDDINIGGLLARLSGVKEIILATNTDVEGEATATYIRRLLEDQPLTVTRIAHGVPVGGNLEYTDEVTLIKAMENRRKL